MSNKIKGRLQTPVGENGTRVDIHLITTSDEVLVPDNENEPKTLTTVLNNIHGNIIIGSTKPDYPTMWFRTSD